MSTKDRREGKEAEQLRKLGYEYQPPVDDYSYQPDSGSRIGGITGKQEYGIQGGVSWEVDHHGKVDGLQDRIPTDEITTESTGVSDFSVCATHGVEALEEAARASHPQLMPPQYLESLIQERLDHHNQIAPHTLAISATPAGVVTITGQVRRDAERLRIEEVVAAIPGVTEVENRITVRGK